MISRIVIIALAFTGLMVGAGMATGQETVQYFMSFGTDGIWGVVLAGAIISISGLVILQLGSYYRADSHSKVFNSLTHRLVATFLDICVTVTVFALGCVMMAGAGSTMAQQFGWPVWVGSAVMLALVLLTGLLDVNKVTKVIGYATPVVIVAIAVAFVFSLVQLPVDLDALDQLSRQEPSPITPWWLSAINYAGLVLITAVSMVLVIGGSYFHPKEAGWGGLVGGMILTALLLMLALELLLSFDKVTGVPVPTLALFTSMHPAFGTVMVWIIYLMIYSTCIGQYYSLGRRLSTSNARRFYPSFATAALLGFVISFVGFEALMASVCLSGTGLFGAGAGGRSGRGLFARMAEHRCGVRAPRRDSSALHQAGAPETELHPHPCARAEAACRRVRYGRKGHQGGNRRGRQPALKVQSEDPRRPPAASLSHPQDRTIRLSASAQRSTH